MFCFPKYVNYCSLIETNVRAGAILHIWNALCAYLSHA